MYIFNADPLRIRDEAGQLRLSGARWSEPREWISEPVEGVLPWMVMGVPFALFLASFDPAEKMQLYAIAGGLAVGSLVIAIFGFLVCNLNRELYFHANGTIVMPKGQPGWFKGTVVQEGRVSEVSAIQVEPQEEGIEKKTDRPAKFNVCIYFDDGSMACIAENLQKRDAHKVTVLLVKALAAISEARGRLPTQDDMQEADWQESAFID